IRNLQILQLRSRWRYNPGRPVFALYSWCSTGFEPKVHCKFVIASYTELANSPAAQQVEI
ncbi:MAG: hypothetical protein QW728_02205, partial [Thermoplasmata archaeon]